MKLSSHPFRSSLTLPALTALLPALTALLPGLALVGLTGTAAAQISVGGSAEASASSEDGAAGSAEAGADAAASPAETQPPEAQPEETPAASGPETEPEAASAETTEGSPAPSYDYAGARADRNPDPYDLQVRYNQLPYMDRYLPEGCLWEVGLFMGLFLPSSSHNLKVPQLPYEEYSGANFAVGGRVAWFLPKDFGKYLGVELEGMAAAGKTQDTDRSAVFYSARAHGIAQLPLWSVVPFAVVGGGALGAVSESMGHDVDPMFHWGLGVKAPVTHTTGFRFDFRHDLTQAGPDANQGAQASHFELLLGVDFTFRRTPPAAPVDTDYDGLFDEEDKCPLDGALTIDGCPPPAADADGDGVPDTEDQCPAEAGQAPTGCPERDHDRDGVPIPADQCPDEPGPAPTGCPDKDEDGDGIIEGDKCPKAPENRNGFEDDDGCPDEVPEAIKRFTGVIRGINFKQGTADIEEASFETLDAAIETLKQYESIRIEVSGHTSSEGTQERNQELSDERAHAVKDYMVEKGVAEERIVARGAGSSEPIADNETREGRQQNRRIEIRILSQK